MKRKHGFTIIELVIVIAVIGVLAAILIPTLTLVINKAKMASDLSLVKNMNTCLEVDNKEHKTMYSALTAIKGNGIEEKNVKNLALGDEQFVAWDRNNDRFVLVSKSDDSFVYPKNDGDEKGIIDNYHDYFAIFEKVPASSNQKYSIYLSEEAKISTLTVSVGFDAGNNNRVTSLTYDRHEATSSRDVLIRTNTGTACTYYGYVDGEGKGDSIYHYGEAGSQRIDCANLSFYEHGGATENIVDKGHYVQESGSIVAVVEASATNGNVDVELLRGSIQGTVKNTNESNEVSIKSEEGVTTVSLEAKTDGGNLKVDLASQPTYSNTCDKEEIQEEKSVVIRGVGDGVQGKENQEAPASHIICPDGHDYILVAGYSVKVCSRCGAYEYSEPVIYEDSHQHQEEEEEELPTENTYTINHNGNGEMAEPVKIHEHNFGGEDDIIWTWEDNVYDQATAYFLCVDEDCHQSETVIIPDDSGYITNSITKEPTCTETGERTYVAHLTHHQIEFENSVVETVSSLGHDYDAVVTVPTCTEGGYTTHTCSRCGDTYIDSEVGALGHDIVHHEAQEPTYESVGWYAYDTCTRCDYSTYEERPVLELSTKFVNSDQYLYRVGNQNAVAITSLFDAVPASVSITSIQNDANGTYNSGNNSIEFNGTGVVKVTANNTIELYLEVIDAYNATSATSAINKDIVLLNDVNGTFTVDNGHTFYGNGFTVRASGNGQSKSFESEAIIRINRGNIDNTVIICDVFPIGYMFWSEAASAQDASGYRPYIRPAVGVFGDAKITNSYISGGRAAVRLGNFANVEISNTTLEGGSLCNLLISSVKELILENVTTIQKPTISSYQNKDVLGLGIFSENTETNPKIILRGDLLQYNWISSADKKYLASAYQSVFDVVFSKSQFIHNVNGTQYVNLGLIFANGNALNIVDERENKNSIPYQEDSVSFYEVTGKVYSYLNSQGNVNSQRFDSSNVIPYEPVAQSIIEPTTVFDYTTKNYIANTGNDNYCFYDSADGKVKISLKQENVSDAFSYDPMIFNASKYGHNLAYTVQMGGIDYTNKTISFSESGEYVISFFYTDPYNYDETSTSFAVNYQKDLHISVNIIEPDNMVYHTEFSYAGSWSSNSAKQVAIGNDTYIMPNVTSTSSIIGSTTVGGETVYYPIITIDGKTSGGGSYSSGKIYYFAPAFSAINIKDLNKDTGATLYTYNSSTQKWPHNISAATGPGDSAYYGPYSTRDPYGAATGATYEKYAYNSSNGGLCFTSNEIERNVKANTKLVKFHYVGNDGITYYYYIQYKYNATTYVSGGCFAPGTMITLADGSKKAIENITNDDIVLSYNFFTGAFEGNKVCFIADHGQDYYPVTDLLFDDGTKLTIIADHGLFDYDLNQFIYVSNETVSEYLNHSFYKEDGTLIKLIGFTMEEKMIHAYSITSSYNMNSFANGLLTTPPPDEFYNWVKMDETTKMRYDSESFFKDVETYGLLDYSFFADSVPYEIYDAFNGKYLGIAIAKGLLTEEALFEIINTYSVFWQ